MLQNAPNPVDESLHGNVPDFAQVALLIIDVVNDLEFEGGQELLRHALPMAQRLAELKKRLRQQNVPIVYVNDNFGKWQSDFNKIVRHCLSAEVRGRPIAELLSPEGDDYFVLKPKHSGFFSTTLDLLLRYLGVHTLILTGIAANNCVLFTANDAYMRDYQIIVPADCVASIESEATESALKQMQKVLKADIRPSNEIDLEELISDTEEAKRGERFHGQSDQQRATAESRYSG